MSASPLLLVRFTAVQTGYQIGSVLLMAVGILAATPLAPDPVLGALPLALSVVGTFLSLFPASVFLRRWGKRPGLFVGLALGLVGTGAIAAGLVAHSFALVCAGFLVYGVHQAFLQYLRFLAMESVEPAEGSRALSWILVGGIPAAFLGPLVGLWGRDLVPGVPFAGCFLLLGGVLITQSLLVATLPRGAVAEGGGPAGEPPRPWGSRLADPVLWLAVTAATFSYGLMILLMASTPPAMHAHGHDLAASTLVIQAHVLGMFVPSLFSGWLVRRWGPRALIGVGLGIFGLVLVTALQGTTFLPFFVSMTLLGVGWNFLYVGGTNLLTTTYRPAERAGTQALNDSFVYLFATAATFGAGVTQQSLGWEGMQWLTVPFLVVVAALLVTTGRRGRPRA